MKRKKADKSGDGKVTVSTAELEAIVFGALEKQSEDPEGARQVEETPKAAWVDPDDANLEVPLAGKRKRLRKADRHVKGDEYEQILRERFTKLNGVARWTQVKPMAEAEPSDSDDGEVVASSLPPVVKGGMLKPTKLDIQRMREVPMLATGQKKGSSAIEALQFHPNSELLLTAGRDKTLRLFAVDGEDNPKVASYYFKRCPLLGASFTPLGDEVLMTSTTSQMWGLDVASGEIFEVRNMSSERSNFSSLVVGPSPLQVSGLKSSQMYAVLGDAGTISLCDVKSKHTIRTLRMSTAGASLSFARDRDVLYSADEACNIYEWDLLSGRCHQKVKEQSATRIQCLVASRRQLAVGTSTGNVDILDLSGPKLSGIPVQSIDNLTTRIDALRYNFDEQIFGVCSRMKPGALKLVHAQTTTVFQNWPTEKTPLHHVSALDFSKHVLAIGNELGRVLLYRLKHYSG